MDRLKGQKSLVLHLVILGFIIIVLYLPFLWELFHAWVADEDYSHGFLIAPISLYLVWRMRSDLLAQEIHPSHGVGVLMLFAWAALYFIGTVGQIYTFTALSFLLFLFSVTIFLAGYSITVKLLFPIVFLVFMMPVPSEIYTRVTNPMMLVVTTVSTHILNLIGLPVLQEGNLISLPNYTMRVIHACSGIRSLISVSALALLVGYLLFFSNLKRLLLFLFALPVAFIGNIVRVVVTALVAFYISPDHADGFSHSLAGIITFILSLGMISLGVVFLQWLSPTRD